MIISEFIAAIETYYGITYNIVELKIIQAFLKSNIDDLEKFFAAVISHHSKKWRSLPDLVIFREIAGDTNNLDLQAEKAWQALLKNSTAHDVIIVDPIAYFIVSGYGSWDRFCQERDGFYRELNHKSFIDRYITAARSGVSETPRPLAGHYRLEYGPSFQGLKTEIIGDQDQGRLLLEGMKRNKEIENLSGFLKQV